MGEYWQVCNLTRKQMYDQRGGYKTRGTMTNEMRGAVLVLLAIGAWQETDDIRLLSDMGGERLLNKETWEATEERGPGTSEVQFCDLQDVHLELVVGPSPFQVVYTPLNPGPLIVTPPPPMLTAEQLWAMQLLREQFGFESAAAEQFARRITNGQLAPDAQGQTPPTDLALLDRLLASKRNEQRETSGRWGGSS